ncbi:MAG: undecaprenyldiphospho-muramoylpentapeptide beta-N-acetylglucosaminyltransferase [Desulfovibrio sp.]|jgi:UDP-N-acetylglucosamine--N-acetylmuramyl-(pentapeptide) pyrophosphoryl-undecaprenol N-acetylglucosamine transferase|nr:undecaprenyldiphospho-muramoylpentapeptide beta-N-acetylglucosaminyltransferase [Desulfovibrio sp.]
MDRVIITTGGTGGHIFPALSLAEEIRRRNPGAMVLFMGGQYGLEADLAAKAGLDFAGLPVRGVMGRGFKGAAAALGMLRGIAEALRVIRKTKPEMVVGFGGYAAFAGVLAGRMRGLPTAIHEQNAFPGMSNRLLGRVADRIFLSMPIRDSVFDPARCVLVGNPVRAGIVALHESLRARGEADGARSCFGGVDAPSPFTGGGVQDDSADAAKDAAADGPCRLLVMGGSQGAKALNDGVLASLGPLLEAGIVIRHQTGQADYERVRAAYREAMAEHVRVEAFINDMPKAYAWADLALCRAGASSLAEITAAGLPAVLAPFPQAAQDHQRHNARFLEKVGAALRVEQADFKREPAVLTKALLSLVKDRERLAAMAEKSLALAKPYAARDLADGLEDLLEKRRAGDPGRTEKSHAK